MSRCVGLVRARLTDVVDVAIPRRWVLTIGAAARKQVVDLIGSEEEDAAQQQGPQLRRVGLRVGQREGATPRATWLGVWVRVRFRVRVRVRVRVRFRVRVRVRVRVCAAP